jgi:hypothetical protein
VKHANMIERSRTVSSTLQRAVLERNKLIESHPTPNVTIVSLCQYDPGKTPLGMLSIHNKIEYANRHGYEYVLNIIMF